MLLDNRSQAIKALALVVAFCGTVSAQSASFPSAVVGQSQLMVAANNVQTTLAANMGTGDTTFTVNVPTGFVANSLATIDKEIVRICNVSGNTLSVGTASSCPSVAGRGWDGTTITTHSGVSGSAALVSLFIDAWHHNAPAAEIIALETALGANLSNIPGSPSGGVIPINKGGTNATTVNGALSNLGAPSLTGSNTFSSVNVFSNVLQVTGGAAFQGTADSSGSAHSLPFKVGLTASLPVLCTVGEKYFATDATAGFNDYSCTATNTWTQDTFSAFAFTNITSGTNTTASMALGPGSQLIGAGGYVDFGSAGSTRPFLTGTTAAIPVTCTPGQKYFALDATAGRNDYNCTAANTWTQETGGGGTPAFNTITSGTNTTAAMVVGTGGSLAPTGSGTIKGTSVVDSNQLDVLRAIATSTAVDQWSMTNGATGTPGLVILSATGTDSNINARILAKGTGVVQLGSTNAYVDSTGALTVSTCSGCGAGGGLPVIDTTAVVKNASDNTKLVKISAANVSTATTITVSVQNANYTLAGLENNQTFTGNDIFNDTVLVGLASTDVTDTGGLVTSGPQVIATATTNASVLSLSAVASTYTAIGSNRSGSGTYLPLAFFTGGSEAMRILTSGIITTEGATADDGSGAAIQITQGTLSAGEVASVYNPLRFYTSGTERLRIQTNGYVLSGFTSTDLSLSAGTIVSPALIAATSTSNASITDVGVLALTYSYLAAGRSGSGTFLPLAFFTDGTEAMRVTTNQEVLVGRTSDDGTGSKFQVNGTGSFDTEVIAGVTGSNPSVFFAGNTSGTGQINLTDPGGSSHGIGIAVNGAGTTISIEGSFGVTKTCTSLPTVKSGLIVSC